MKRTRRRRSSKLEPHLLGYNETWTPTCWWVTTLQQMKQTSASPHVSRTQLTVLPDKPTEQKQSDTCCFTFAVTTFRNSRTVGEQSDGARRWWELSVNKRCYIREVGGFKVGLIAVQMVAVKNIKSLIKPCKSLPELQDENMKWQLNSFSFRVVVIESFRAEIIISASNMSRKLHFYDVQIFFSSEDGRKLLHRYLYVRREIYHECHYFYQKTVSLKMSPTRRLHSFFCLSTLNLLWDFMSL